MIHPLGIARLRSDVPGSCTWPPTGPNLSPGLRYSMHCTRYGTLVTRVRCRQVPQLGKFLREATARVPGIFFTEPFRVCLRISPGTHEASSLSSELVMP